MAETVKMEPNLCQITDLPNKKGGLNTQVGGGDGEM